MASIDIIVPVYNVEKYLDNCMESLLSQTYDDYRIILIDDGSTDQSGIICDRYALLHSNIIVRHKKNGGSSSARNAGLSMVEAQYIMFVDSDDFIRKDTLRNLIYIAEIEDADVVKFGIASTDEHGVVKESVNISSEGQVPYTTETQNKEWVYTFGHATAKLYKAQIAKNVMFPEGLIYEDYYYSAVVASLVHKIAETVEKMYFYRENQQSITHTCHESHGQDKFKIFDEILKYYNEHRIYEMYREELEYLYSKFCFINACKTAAISYLKPYQFVRECSLRIKQRYPKFQQNKIFRQRCTPTVKLLTFLIMYFPEVFVVISKAIVIVKK